ncbi:hypothetical protein INT45_002368 [Circinella minor]|uniref:Uncharacterized protein n=1 Tax=Circinella minor TaxID=1195481 RepID=A0A8H7RWY2_9FUNG|nr:hypothetical protein INT45_002368 [Circinella minor]
MKYFVGPHAVDKYKGIPTEWPNLMKSDVVYEPFSYSDRNLALVLIEIKHTVYLKLYQRVIQYCLQMIKRYPVFPIVVIIGINSTTHDILKTVEKDDPEFPLVLNSLAVASTSITSGISAQKPRQKVYEVKDLSGTVLSTKHQVNGGTIRTYLDSSPIEPTVALAHFFIKQKLSLISMDQRDDRTIQLLLKYAKDIFNDDIADYNSVFDAFKTTCNQFHQQLIKARQTLTEDVRNTQSRKHTAQVLDGGILFVNEMRKKHSSSQEPPGTSSSSSATSSTTSLPTSPL